MAQAKPMRTSVYPIQFPQAGVPACGEYVRTEEVDNVLMPNLTNTLHIIFRQDAFDPAFPVQYLMPALQLCSKLLETDAALSWFYTVFTSKGRQVGFYGRTQIQMWEYVSDYRNTVLTAEQKKHTRHLLGELSSVIKFKVQPPKSAGHETKVKWMGASTHFSQFPRYVDIKMALDGLLVPGADADPIMKLNFQMSMVSAFMHELGHAATSCRRDEMWFFPGDNMCEEGYSFENQLFGGCIDSWSYGDMNSRIPGKQIPYYVMDGQESDFSEMMVLKAWPNPGKCLEYYQNDSYFGHRGQICESTVHWNMDIARIAQLFQDDYWRTSSFGFEATQFPKTTGLVVRATSTASGVEETPRHTTPHPHMLPASDTHEFVTRVSAVDGLVHMVVPKGRLAPMLQKLVTVDDIKDLLRGRRVKVEEFFELVKGPAQGRWSEVLNMVASVSFVDITPGVGHFLNLKPGA